MDVESRSLEVGKLIAEEGSFFVEGSEGKRLEGKKKREEEKGKKWLIVSIAATLASVLLIPHTRHRSNTSNS